jgi:hypothetical protein
MRFRSALPLLISVPLSLSAADSAGVQFFEAKIRPVLAARCYACHSAQAPKPQAGLLLDSEAGIKRGGNSGSPVNVNDPEKSVLLRAIRYQDKDLKMPPGKPLGPENIADFEQWVRAGAPMRADARITPAAPKAADFWAFRAPVKSAIPQVKNSAWARNEIDRFILAKLEQKGLAPAEAADKRTLMRRATYDLTGLPPSASEIDSFVADQRPDAYERLIDRLLASPRYGERWGRFWLDIARYSDARGAGSRFAFSYTYRDWVIRAFNEDLPFDQFLVQQLAADRVSNNDSRNLAALGFLSLGREFPKSFPETVDDRIDTVARGMLGLTVACARCHDHKYDPIPTKDYYSFYAIFSNIHEPEDLPLLRAVHGGGAKDRLYEERLARIRAIDRDYRIKRSAEMNAFFRSQTAEYLLAVHDSAKMSNTEIEELVRERQLNLHVLARWRKYLEAVRSSGDPVFRAWHTQGKSLEGANRLVAAALSAHPPASVKELATAYAMVLAKYDSAEKRTVPEEEALRLALRGPDAPANVPVNEFELVYTEGDGNNTRGFHDRYEAMRATYAYDGAAARAMAVEDVPAPKRAHVFVRGNPNNPGAETPPHFLTCLTKGEPALFRDGSGRLDLARAIADKGNPLTARVMVNRVWMHHFGNGIVRTPSDFGLRGDPPTHPELLDYLAVRFMESGWSVKNLQRTIMLSAAYRQSSADNPDTRKIDPENTLLWRMNRQRLDIESLRDSMLAASGQLDLTMGGVPFSLTAQPSVPRRTVYGYIERGRIPGMLSAFDFASPDQHAPLRYTTTVPQQALFLLNSSFVAEQSRSLVSRLKETGDGERIEALYRLALGRSPSAREFELGLKFVEQAAESVADRAAPLPWAYGLGDGRTFTPFRFFTGDSWQAGSMLPDADLGKGRLRANGGEPGDDASQSVIRRWTSPVAGKISIEGTLRHNQGAVEAGDGVRARIVSSRHGEIASWVANGSSAETKLSGIRVEPGDVVDFIVDGRSDTENDAFQWAPSIKAGDKVWSAAADFRGPEARPLNKWERYAQVLLEMNEFAFVD